MARTAAISFKGTTFGYAATSGASLQLVGEVVSVSVPEWSTSYADATHYTSEDSMTESVGTGWGELSDAEVTINFAKTQTATLYGLRNTPKYYSVVAPDGSKWEWYGEISKIGPVSPLPNKDVGRVKCSIKHLGKQITYTPAP